LNFSGTTTANYSGKVHPETLFFDVEGNKEAKLGAERQPCYGQEGFQRPAIGVAIPNLGCPEGKRGLASIAMVSPMTAGQLGDAPAPNPLFAQYKLKYALQNRAMATHASPLQPLVIAIGKAKFNYASMEQSGQVS